MKKLVRKDQDSRQNYLVYESPKFVLSYSLGNSMLSNSVRTNLFLQSLNLPRKSSITRYVSRCIVTGRRKRINKLFSFSRLALSRFFRSGLLFPLRKSRW
jgi:ribosomal protein S14